MTLGKRISAVRRHAWVQYPRMVKGQNATKGRRARPRKRDLPVSR